MLMAGVKLTAHEAYERGLVTRVFPQAEFPQRLTEAVQHIASLPPMVHVPTTVHNNYHNYTLVIQCRVCDSICTMSCMYTPAVMYNVLLPLVRSLCEPHDHDHFLKALGHDISKRFVTKFKRIVRGPSFR